MSKKERIARHSAEELGRLRRAGKSRSDWKRSAAMTSKEVEASVASDPEEVGMIVDWESASIEMPQAKAVLNMRVDRDVLDYFRRTGRGYQTRINAVLRAFVRARRSESGKAGRHRSSAG